jgi:hypothetical protein
MGIPADERKEPGEACPYDQAPDAGWRHPYGSLAEGETGVAGPADAHPKASGATAGPGLFRPRLRSPTAVFWNWGQSERLTPGERTA